MLYPWQVDAEQAVSSLPKQGRQAIERAAVIEPPMEYYPSRLL